jgi:hypothetical protein
MDIPDSITHEQYMAFKADQSSYVGRYFLSDDENGTQAIYVHKIREYFGDNRAVAKRALIYQDNGETIYIFESNYIVEWYNVKAKLECTRAEYDAVIAKIRAALDGGA